MRRQMVAVVLGSRAHMLVICARVAGCCCVKKCYERSLKTMHMYVLMKPVAIASVQCAVAHRGFRW